MTYSGSKNRLLGPGLRPEAYASFQKTPLPLPHYNEAALVAPAQQYRFDYLSDHLSKVPKVLVALVLRSFDLWDPLGSQIDYDAGDAGIRPWLKIGCHVLGDDPVRRVRRRAVASPQATIVAVDRSRPRCRSGVGDAARVHAVPRRRGAGDHRARVSGDRRGRDVGHEPPRRCAIAAHAIAAAALTFSDSM